VSNPHPVVFVRQYIGSDAAQANPVAVFRTLAAAKHFPWYDKRIELGMARWRGDQWQSTLWDDDLGRVIVVERKTVRTE
jgi:hypothetical protein